VAQAVTAWSRLSFPMWHISVHYLSSIAGPSSVPLKSHQPRIQFYYMYKKALTYRGFRFLYVFDRTLQKAGPMAVRGSKSQDLMAGLKLMAPSCCQSVGGSHSIAKTAKL